MITYRLYATKRGIMVPLGETITYENLVCPSDP